MKIVAIIVCVLIFFTGCGPLEGTGTGNPRKNYSSGSSPGYSIFLSVCAKIVACHGEARLDFCKAGIANLHTFGTKLGLQDDPSPSVSEIFYMLNMRTRPIDDKVVTQCLVETDNLKCDQPGVVSSYDSETENPYATAADLLPASCTGVFPSDSLAQ